MDSLERQSTIVVEHLSKTYGNVRAVDDLSFEVKSSLCFGFLGPNGAGKTTTMKILYGKAAPDSRSDTVIQVFGFDPRQEELHIKSRTGIVPQEDNLDVELNVLQNLRIYAMLNGLRWNKIKKHVHYLLDFMELSDRAKSSVRSLSGGMKRRLIIARALVSQPNLLILDEPTTGLDPQVRQLIWNKLRALKREGVTLLLTTHYMEEAYQLSDHIFIMDKGKKILEGAPRQLLEESIESHVLEILNVNIFNEIRERLDKADARLEDTGDRLLCYSNTSQCLSALANRLHAGDYFLRRTNLEDLFLKVTGRNLNELQ